MCARYDDRNAANPMYTHDRRTEIVGQALGQLGQETACAIAPNPDTVVGASHITGQLLADLERRLTTAEEAMFGPRPVDNNEARTDELGLLARGRRNVDRISNALTRTNELLAAIGV